MTQPAPTRLSPGQPLLRLEKVSRAFPAGEGTLVVLKEVDLTIEAGEMVAIIGASGSGKSTLMNILGCLDRPSGGTYRVNGRDTRDLGPDDLAALRRDHFGFIFQRYHLLGTLDAVGNVEIPSIYAGWPRAERDRRARALLQRLGLEGRLGHRPGQLSGGQQQRVSVARALMNGGRVILADEPTGALDSASGQDMLALLEELNAEGHTVVIVTHDPKVAAHAERVIEISDGAILSDTRRQPVRTDGPGASRPPAEPAGAAPRRGALAALGRLGEALRMARLAMWAHRLRTFLTMLGIIIGIASVVSVVALGEGSRQRILANISAIGTNTIDVMPGKSFGDRRAGRIETLVPADAAAIAEQPYVDSVTPQVSSSGTLRYRNVALDATVNGVGPAYFRVQGYRLTAGMAFTEASVTRRAQEVVIDHNTRDQIFGPDRDPVGEVIFLGSVPCRIIGVTAEKTSLFGGGTSLNVWIPYTTAMSRIIGQSHLNRVTVRVRDDYATETAENNIRALLLARHGGIDFHLRNTDTIRQTIQGTTETMTLLISSIALISLVVGGIGVMNIMLVSVTERTREIGVRMAVGARRGDIQQQFLVEAVLVCLLGGALGVLLALALGQLVEHLNGQISMIYSAQSMLLAFACSTLIGIVFGYLPARSAARLDPVEALARE
ncbi:MacB family efflux pump subunit [Roseospirillum parvum]|uniref:Pyoverdine export ATP-binding/permease protein PvdT n=1 Tax=Roseospirillum parvum TaxID=83401 RepID=A0A1G8AQ26_9PROT|nr:MacB family efflux pump subunit [Roseospirillum parvum]SDH22846.1 macrolide transport system ATP-binding/permease protein [Roseospirillum parvum]